MLLRQRLPNNRATRQQAQVPCRGPMTTRPKLNPLTALPVEANPYVLRNKLELHQVSFIKTVTTPKTGNVTKVANQYQVNGRHMRT